MYPDGSTSDAPHRRLSPTLLHPTLPLLLVLLLLLPAPADSTVYALPDNPQPLIKNEQNSLLDFYYSTNGPNWGPGPTWDLGKADDPCGAGWYGVRCNDEGRVTHLHLSANNLQGSIPHTLGRLKKLREIGFAENMLTGAIPSELTNLKRLSILRLSNNNFASVPGDLSKMTRLRELSLDGNAALKIPSVLARMADRGTCPPRGGQICCNVNYDAANVVPV